MNKGKKSTGNSKKRETITNWDHPMFIQRRLQNQARSNAQNFKEPQSFCRFEQTAAEKAELKKVIKAHKEYMRKKGFDPKTRLNVNDPQKMTFAAA